MARSTVRTAPCATRARRSLHPVCEHVFACVTLALFDTQHVMRFWWVFLLAGCGQSHSADSIDAATDNAVDAARSVDATATPDGSTVVNDPCFPSPHAGHSLYS